MELLQYQGLVVFGLTMVVAVGGFLLRSHILQIVAEKTNGVAQASAVKALDDRIDAHDGRLASIETALRHLPTAEQMNALTLVVADLRGDVRAVGARLEGMEKLMTATGRKVELIDEHLKRGA